MSGSQPACHVLAVEACGDPTRDEAHSTLVRSARPVVDDVPARRLDGPATMPVDETGWWETERAHLIRELVTELTGPNALLADIGCGRGGVLSGTAVGRRVVVNVDSYRWREWEPRVGVSFVVAAADALPFRDGAFDLVGSFDVLEHLADDQLAVREQARVVRPKGHVVAAIPADRRLWSAHDEAVGHHRRYDRATIAELFDAENLHVMRVTNFFSFLWFPAFLTRSRRTRRRPPGNGPGRASQVLRRVIAGMSRIERWWFRRWSLPVGTSLWIEARRKPEA
jgi:SAM-dependent methyltransferase